MYIHWTSFLTNVKLQFDLLPNVRSNDFSDKKTIKDKNSQSSREL